MSTSTITVPLDEWQRLRERAESAESALKVYQLMFSKAELDARVSDFNAYEAGGPYFVQEKPNAT